MKKAFTGIIYSSFTKNLSVFKKWFIFHLHCSRLRDFKFGCSEANALNDLPTIYREITKFNVTSQAPARASINKWMGQPIKNSKFSYKNEWKQLFESWNLSKHFEF